MKWLPDYFNDIGFIVTFIGFAFTIIQIFIIKSRQKTIQIATHQAIKKIAEMDHLSLITKCNEIVSDMKRMVIDEQYAMIDRTLPEVKSALIHCQNICTADRNKIIETIRILGTNQNNINKILSNKNNDFEKEIFLSNLDEIKDIFSSAIQLCKQKL